MTYHINQIINNCLLLPKCVYFKPNILVGLFQGGRGHWSVIILVPKFYNKVFLFVGLTTLRTLSEFSLIL